MYQKFLPRTMHGESFALEVDSDDDIDDFLNLANIF